MHTALIRGCVEELEPFFDGYIHILRETNNDPSRPIFGISHFRVVTALLDSVLAARTISSLSRKGVVMISRGSSDATLYGAQAAQPTMHSSFPTICFFDSLTLVRPAG